MRVDVHKFATDGPADVSKLEAAIDRGEIDPANVICIIGKTEGNGGRNDFTRDLAMFAFEDLFSRKLGIDRREVTERLIFSLSGGCEGVVAPHIVVFSKSGNEASAPLKQKRLAVGIGFTREFAPEEIGRMSQIEETSAVIKRIVSELKVESDRDVHLVQMKGAIPSYSFEQAQEAERAGRPIRSDMVYSRAASALAAAVALNEVSIKELSDDSVCRDWSRYSSVASCSAKPGLKRTEIMVMANSPYWDGNIAINHGVLQDMIDVKSVHATLEGLGIKPSVQLTDEERSRILGVFAKSEADPRGEIRGRRHTMLTDDDISDSRYSRCVLGAVLASIIGDTTIYISTRAEHHGPLGGGTLAILARQD
jgi:cyanuric acid amidohydrolase